MSFNARQWACEVDGAVVHALETGDRSKLSAIGNGEFSVVLAWPSDAPSAVVKPIGPFRQSEYRAYEELLHQYVEALRQRNIDVVETEMVPVARGPKWIVGYMFQPLLPRDQLAERALAAREPSSDDPILEGIASVLMGCDGELSIDPPVSNWHWDGNRARLLDVGMPLMWDHHAKRRIDFAPFMRSLPIGTRTLFRRGWEEGTDRMRERRNLAIEFVARLDYFGLGSWEDAATRLFNTLMKDRERIDLDEVKALQAQDTADLARFKRLQNLQRRVKSSPLPGRYEFLLGSSTY